MCELQPESVTNNCHFFLTISSEVLRKDFQNLSLTYSSLLSRISMSSFPGVVTSSHSNPLLFKIILIDSGLKKFKWCGGDTDGEFSHSTCMSRPVLESVVKINISFDLIIL